MPRRRQAGLTHAWIESEVAHQFLWRGEPTDIADCSHQADRDGDVDSRDRQQTMHLRIVQGRLRERSVDDRKVFTQLV